MIAGIGPNGAFTSGSYDVPELGMFTGWVARTDSFADCQPILGGRGEIALVFSGECFVDGDYHVIHERRERRSTTHTGAWLADAYERLGERFFAELNGIFAGFLIDRRQRRAWLFNDRYGLDRVYYHQSQDGFYFSSEAKALLHILPELRAFDEVALTEFLDYGCALGWKSLFRNVQLLPAGSAWAFDGATCAKRQYFTASAWESQPPLTVTAFEAKFQDTFDRILPRYFQPDSPIGISLTGGLDSRMIMACRPTDELVAYTFAGLDGLTFDARLASRVSAECRVPHHILRIGRDFLSQFASLADRTVYVTDGAFGICGAHEIYLNNLASALVPVRLTGNFGSEILRGVTTFKPRRLALDLVDRDSGKGVASRAAPVHPVSFAAFQEIPWLLFGVVRAAQSHVIWRTPYLDNEVVALAFQTPPGLRGSPEPALRLIERKDKGLARIPTDAGLVPSSRLATLLKSSWCRTTFKLDYLYNEGMPHWLSRADSCLARLDAHHRVFGSHKYLHYRRWFRRELAGYVVERLSDPATSRCGPWNRAFLEQIAQDHAKGQKNHVREIDAVLTLDAICRLLFREDNPCHHS